jgi:hypothetical protein
LTKRALAVLIACLAIAAVAAGCGGGSDSTSSGDTTSGGGESTEASGSAPTKAAFIKEADKICGDADEELNEEIVEYAKENDIDLEKSEPSEDEQFEIVETVVLPNLAKQSEEISALTPPEGEEEKVEEITDALSEGVEEGESDPKSLSNEDNSLADAGKKAQAYGLTTCGSE